MTALRLLAVYYDASASFWDMFFGVVGVVIGVSVLIALWLEWRRKRRPPPIVSSEESPTPPFDERLLAPITADGEGLAAHATRDEEGWRLVVEVEAPPDKPGGSRRRPDLVLEPTPFRSAARRTGDALLDRRYTITASDAVWARCDRELRTALVRSDLKWSYRDGRLEAKAEGWRSYEGLQGLLAHGRAIGKALLDTLDTSAPALLEAFADPLWRVRVTALRELLRRHPQSPELVTAFEWIEADPSPRLRVFALSLAHDVERLVEAARQHDRGGRSEAIEALMRIAPEDPRTHALVADAISRRDGLDDERVHELIDGVATRPEELLRMVSHEDLQRFLLLFVESPDPVLAERSRKVLGGFGDGFALAELNRRLDESPENEGLGRVVVAIRERLGDGSVGGLTLAGGGGELTLAPAREEAAD